jgi:hypothetical protein
MTDTYVYGENSWGEYFAQSGDTPSEVEFVSIGSLTQENTLTFCSHDNSREASQPYNLITFWDGKTPPFFSRLSAETRVMTSQCVAETPD